MQRAIKYIVTSILLLAAATSVWFLLNNLQSFEPALYSFVAIVFVTIALCLKLFANIFLHRIKNLFISITKLKYFTPLSIAVVTLLAILTRFYFYFKFSYSPVSDPLTYYEAAQKVSNGQGVMGDNYIAFFPHTAAYDNILGLVMKFVSDPWVATIALNTTFDICGAFVVYLLIKRLTKPGSKLPLIGFGLWLLSPFNILFSVLSLPIVIVNFFIILTIFVVYMLVKSLLANKLILTLVLALILGVAIGYANCFRPIFPIVLIALFLLFIYILLTNRRTTKLLLLLGASFVLIAAIFFGIQKLNTTLVEAQTGLDASSAGGWNIYVGSNSESDGTWNRSDKHRLLEICKDAPTNKDCHAKLQEAAIKRYKHQGIDGTLNLFVRKLYRFSSDQTFVYNANASIDDYSDSKTAKVIGIYTIIFVAMLFAFSARFLYLSAKRTMSNKKIVPIVIFASILMLGFFLSTILVETSLRYAQVIYPIFTLFAVLALDLSISKSLKVEPSA